MIIENPYRLEKMGRMLLFGLAPLFLALVLFGQDVMAGPVSEPCVTPDGRPGHMERDEAQAGGHYGPCIADEGSVCPFRGTLQPKYNILTVVYAPPGKAGGGSDSVVEYSQGSTTGTTISASNSFKSDVNITATVGSDLIGTAGGAFSLTKNTTDSSKLDIKKSISTTIRLRGSSVDGIDHDQDIIYLLLNPKIDLELCGRAADWSYGYTGEFADITFVYVGWLKDPTRMPSNVAAYLTSHGLTQDDYNEILKADPFASGSTTIDRNRYWITGTSFPYIPPFSPGDPGPTLTYTQNNDETETQSEGSQHTYSVRQSYNGGMDFLKVFKATIKEETTFTWTHSSDTSVSATRAEKALVTVGSPSYGYRGPVNFNVYYDSLFKSFMFNPISDTTVAVVGMVKKRTRTGVASCVGCEVIMYAHGKKYRTFTDAQGYYRFMGKYASPMQVEVKGAGKKDVPRSLSPQVNFIR